MAKRDQWMIYGSNGYTGRLIAVEAKRRGLKPVLAGRSADPIQTLAVELGLPVKIFVLNDVAPLNAALSDIAIVANCAGPFTATSGPMIDASLKNRIHYLDITGEIEVFLAAQRRDADAKSAGVVVCPGVGFDVIPTDCIAAVLKEALPDATHLTLAFDAGGPMSPGTARTMAESLRFGQRGGRIRRNGLIEEVPLAHSWRRVDFDGGSSPAIAIAWGDIATAWFSTGIPNIETYVKVPFAVAMTGPALNWVRPLLASSLGQAVLQQLAKRSPGPSEEELRTGRSRLWGEVRNPSGVRRTARLEAASGYRLTVDGTLMAVQFLLKNAPLGGYYTPSMLMGLRCVEQLPGSTLIRVQ
jgi:short subunit dehydrogenase-like uncharacterized protein